MHRHPHTASTVSTSSACSSPAPGSSSTREWQPAVATDVEKPAQPLSEFPARKGLDRDLRPGRRPTRGAPPELEAMRSKCTRDN